MTTSFAVSVSTFTSGLSTQTSTPARMCISQQEYAHDTIIMDFWGGDVDSNALASGTPISVSFGRPQLMRNFYGYVNHAQRTNNAMGSDAMSRNALCVTCVGASWPMKETSTRAFYSMTSTQIVEQIADERGLSTDIQPDAQVWPVKNQGGLSDWAFCCELMKEIGYTFYCSGVQIVAKPRQVDPSSLISLAAVFDYRANPSSLPIFSPTLGATNPTGGQLYNRQLATIDPRTNQIVQQTLSGSPTPTNLGLIQNTPPFTKTETFTTASAAELNSKLNGAGQYNQMYVTAQAVGQGNAQIAQGSLVFVQNANGSQNGLWFTTKAKHEFTPQTYQMQLSFGRDSIGATPSFQVMTQTQNAPNANLSGMTWVAT